MRLARLLTDAPLLVRTDSGNDSADNLSILIQEDVDFIIKRNLRNESPQEWLAMAKADGDAKVVRVGKTVYRASLTISRLLILHGQTTERELCCIFEVTERTITADGQMLLVPQMGVDAYWTSLPDRPAIIIEQHHHRSRSQQYHSELNSDMHVERFLSGKVNTNQLVLHCATVAYGILRMIGQMANDTGGFPFQKRAFRRRIKTVIQNLIYLAARLVPHARSCKLAFGRWSPLFPGFARMYQRLRC